MAFNSLQFAAFLLLTLAAYWLGPRSWRLGVLLASSYLFYAYADWRFCGLLALCTVISYGAGHYVAVTDDERARRWATGAGVAGLVGILVVFKYFDFFVDSFADVARTLGFSVPDWTLQLALPIGLSFYALQAISYVVDMYRRDYPPVRSFPVFATYMAFFPQMLAGPIERARRLVPQLSALPDRLRRGQALEGVELIVIGLFKKVAVADVMLRVVVDAYRPFDIAGQNGWFTLLLALPAFGIEIYCDFSGYSDMARGIGKLFGIELSRNFLRPKNSRTVLEFWQRWHITFTRFMRDYLLRPLGGFHGSDLVLFRNAVVIFGISGLWHGARWPLVIWGLTLGVAVGAALIFADWHRKRLRAGLAAPPPGSVRAGVSTLTRPLRVGRLADVRKRAQVLTLLLLTTPLFVAPTLEVAWDVYRGIFTFQSGPMELHHLVTVVYGALMVIVVDRHQQTFEADEDRRSRDRRMGRPGATDISLISSWDWQLRTAFMVLAVVVFGANIQAAEFYYFQF